MPVLARKTSDPTPRGSSHRTSSVWKSSQGRSWGHHPAERRQRQRGRSARCGASPATAATAATPAQPSKLLPCRDSLPSQQPRTPALSTHLFSTFIFSLLSPPRSLYINRDPKASAVQTCCFSRFTIPPLPFGQELARVEHDFFKDGS